MLFFLLLPVRYRYRLLLVIALLVGSASSYAQRNLLTLEYTPTKMIHARVPALEVGVGLVLVGNNRLSYHQGFPVSIGSLVSRPKGVDQRYREWRIRYNRLVRFATDPDDYSGFLYGIEYGVLTERMIYPAGAFVTDEDNVRFAHDGFQRVRVLSSQRVVIGMQHPVNKRLHIQYTMLVGIAQQTRTSRYENLREEALSSSGCGFCFFGSYDLIDLPFTIRSASAYLNTTATEHREQLFYVGGHIRLFYHLVGKQKLPKTK